MIKNMRQRSIIAIWLLALLALSATAQQPVRFTVEEKQTAPDELSVIFQGKIDAGWHVYAPGLGDDGPISASLTTEHSSGVEPIGGLKAIGKEISNFDEMFGMKLRYFENSVQFVQKYRITKEQYQVSGFLEYGACNDRMCLPPSHVEFSHQGTAALTKKDNQQEESTQKPAEETETADTAQTVVDTPQDSLATDSAVAPLEGRNPDLWTPVVSELKALSQSGTADNASWLYLFFMGFVGGLLALFTPCVWPIIPMTVSFFLKRADDKRRGLRDAIIYGCSIVIIYLTLGLIVTALFGPESLNGLATNAIFNIFFFLLLVAFALSFFGLFELTLPSRWSNAIDSKAYATSGLLSIFLMAFTLALVSFSCTAPIIGLLLVESVSSANKIGPAIGMLGFALALALPFTLFAVFPSWLKQAPKSGAWMNIIKVSLGFVELAFALKFFSVADLAYGWHLLDREVFLVLWIAIFLLLGLYLIGVYKFRSDGDGPHRPMPVLCIMLGLVSIAFSLYMVPGLWGAPCKAISAFAPPMNTQDFNLYHNEVKAAYIDYDEGMAAAAREGKPVLLDFTGFGCVNCRKMEAAVWTDPTVASRLTQDYVLISLYVDDKRPLKSPVEINDNGTVRKFRTVGDLWIYLEQHKFGNLTQPFYVAVDPDGHPLTAPYSYDEDIQKYIRFLDEGVTKYRQ